MQTQRTNRWRRSAWAVSLPLGAAGAFLAAWNFPVALAFFLFSGAALAGAGPMPGDGGWLPPAPRPGRATLLFTLSLFAWAAALYLPGLDRLPPGPGFVESAMAIETGPLGALPYTPHLSAIQTVFPSLLFYQGLAATRWLGWGLGALRTPSALWAILSVLAFYYLLRQMVSGFSAALFAVLFSVNNLLLTHGRIYFPGTVLQFSLAASAAFLLAGIRRGRTGLFVAAGLAAGLGLHGYIPGRIILPGLTAWLLWVHWQQRGRASSALRPRHTVAFVLAGLLVGAPIFLWALRNPRPYLGIVTHFGGGFSDELGWLRRVLPGYLKVFFAGADGSLEPTDGLSRFALLEPDILMRMLLPAGLILCSANWRKPVPSLVLGGALAGLVPALFAFGYGYPVTRRMLLALPWAYAAGALAFERLRLHAMAADWWPAHAKALTRGVLLMAACIAALSIGQFFVQIMGRPSVRAAYNVAASELGQELAAHPGWTSQASYDLVLPSTYSLVYPPDVKRRVLAIYPNFIVLSGASGPRPLAVKQFEDMLLFKDARPQLLLLAPSLRSSQALLQALFPHGRARLYEQWRELGEGMRVWDDAEPMVHLLRFEVPVEDVAAFSGLVDLDRPPYAGPVARVDTGAPAFGAAEAGRALSLGGALLLQDGVTPLRFRRPWPGWQLWIDGRSVDWGRPLQFASGAHQLALRGRVPQGARGGLPLAIEQDGVDLVQAGALRPVDPRYGLQAQLQGDGPTARLFRRFELLPLHRYLPPEGLEPSWHGRFSGRLRVPLSGVYRLLLRPIFDGSLSAGGPGRERTVAAGELLTLTLQAGQAVPFSVQGAYTPEHPDRATVYPEFFGPGSKDWAPLPFDWVLAPQPLPPLE